MSRRLRPAVQRLDKPAVVVGELDRVQEVGAAVKGPSKGLPAPPTGDLRVVAALASPAGVTTDARKIAAS